MTSRPLTVLVVDDHPVVRAGVVALLAPEPDLEVVGEVADAESALALIEARQPDLVLMDLRLPGRSGAEATAEIRARWPRVKVLVLTTFDGDEDVFRALKAGAHGYLLKDASRSELLGALRAVAAGQRRISPRAAERLAQRFDASELTARETEVLEGIVGGKANKEIAAALGITEGTVKTHVASILGKLGVSARTEAAVVAIRRGLVRPR